MSPLPCLASSGRVSAHCEKKSRPVQKLRDIELTEDDYRRVSEIAPPGSHVTDYWEGNVYARLRKSVGTRQR